MPGVVYTVSVRCNDRQFLFKPNHAPAAPLLDAGCSPAALDPKNDLVPTPSVINIVGACLGRAQRKHPIRVHWFECNLHHLHIGFSVDDDAMRENVAPFFRTLLSGIARAINKLWGRENHVFGERYRAEPCIDDAAAEQQLHYAIANPVKDGQIERVVESPFFSTFRHAGRGEPLRFWYIDSVGWWQRGGPRKGNREKRFLTWVTVELSPLPALRGLSEHQRRTRMRHLVRDAEKVAAERLALEGRGFVGLEALRRLDPRDRPGSPKESGRQPLCHASDAASRREFERTWREFLQEHRRASIDFLAGSFEREFPDGSFRPPLVTRYSASEL